MKRAQITAHFYIASNVSSPTNRWSVFGIMGCILYWGYLSWLKPVCSIISVIVCLDRSRTSKKYQYNSHGTMTTSELPFRSCESIKSYV